MRGVFSLVLVFLVAQVSYAGLEPNYSSVVPWMLPLVGEHHLRGDEGCEKIKITPQGTVEPTFKIEISAASAVYRRDLSASFKIRAIDDRRLDTSFEASLLSDPPRVYAVELGKDAQGKLSSLTIADWRKYFKLTTYWSLNCYAP